MIGVEIHSYRELRQQIGQDLRFQHPEWMQPNGGRPTCDSSRAERRAYFSWLDEVVLSRKADDF